MWDTPVSLLPSKGWEDRSGPVLSGLSSALCWAQREVRRSESSRAPSTWPSLRPGGSPGWLDDGQVGGS